MGGVLGHCAQQMKARGDSGWSSGPLCSTDEGKGGWWVEVRATVFNRGRQER